MMIIILVIIIFIIFVPIPLIIDLKYEDNILAIHFYNIKINLPESIKHEPVEEAVENAKKRLDLRTVKNIFLTLEGCRIKPNISYRFNFDFGLDDAALTGFTYGMIWCVYPVFNSLVTAIFHLKKCKVDVNPYFNEKIVKLNFHSIIVTSLAKTMYMILFVITHMNKK